MKLAFNLEFNTVDIPTADEICTAIEKYAKSSKEELEFISKSMPVRFYLDGKIYIAKRSSGRGGPSVYCRQE